jgi:membrane fusion protein, heavy metal efflux system
MIPIKHLSRHWTPVFTLALAALLMAVAGCERAEAPPRDAAGGEPAGLDEPAGHAAGEAAAQAGQAHEEPGDSGEEVSDLDRPVEGLLAEQCEHEIAMYTCDECRYEVGMVKVSQDLIDADGPLGIARAAMRAACESEAHNGEVRLNEERAAYLSPRTPGTVQSILVDLGTRVRTGQVLFTVNSPDFAEARSAFLSQRAQLKLAEANLERERDLFEKKICPQMELLEADATHQAAAATCQAARERLLGCGLTDQEIDALATTLGANGGALPVKAPFDGTVLERNLGLGASVEPGQPLLLLGDTTQMWIWTSLYERQMAAVLEQQNRGPVEAHVEVPAYPGRIFTGRVERMGGTLDDATRTVKVRVVVANPEGLLRAGMFARVHLLESDAGEMLTVPADAVLEDEGRAFVFVLAQAPYFVRRPVETGRAGDDWVEITRGLAAGDNVVSRGAFVLKSDVLRSKMGAGCAD